MILLLSSCLLLDEGKITITCEMADSCNSSDTSELQDDTGISNSDTDTSNSDTSNSDTSNSDTSAMNTNSNLNASDQ